MEWVRDEKMVSKMSMLSSVHLSSLSQQRLDFLLEDVKELVHRRKLYRKWVDL